MALAGACVCAASADAQQTKMLTADKHNEYGIVYSLPLTELKIEVTATRTVQKAGPYWQYAKKYIGTDRVIREDAENWTISSVDVSTYGVADPEQRYLMQLKPGATTSVAVAEDGMLLAINAEAPEMPGRAGAETARKAPKAFFRQGISAICQRGLPCLAVVGQAGAAARRKPDGGARRQGVAHARHG